MEQLFEVTSVIFDFSLADNDHSSCPASDVTSTLTRDSVAKLFHQTQTEVMFMIQSYVRLVNRSFCDNFPKHKKSRFLVYSYKVPSTT